jgi:HSP20 family protein
MSLVRWDPFREVTELSRHLNRLFGSIEAPEQAQRQPSDWLPAVDIKESPEEYAIKFEVPGMKKEEIQVGVENGILTVRGERKQEKEERGLRFHRVERSYGMFARSFQLPGLVDTTKVAAEYKDGLLNVRIPKSEPSKPKPVEVKIQ